MTSGQKFCTECGASLVPGTRFCGQCGHPVAGPAPADTVPASRQHLPVQQEAPVTGGPEQIIGIVPFVEQGLLSVIRYTLIVTPKRLIFCTWNRDTDEAMSDAEDAEMQESCTISETTDEIAHFRANDWATGPWQRYRSVPVDSIGPGAPGSLTFPMAAITNVSIVSETRSSTQDKLYVEVNERQHEFDLMYSQGPFLFGLLRPILGERVTIADHLHKRGKLDRLLTGQEYT
jgi:zinc-ribbon domain